jgi:RNA polymerase sigma-70 factor (ECF subfamily)
MRLNLENDAPAREPVAEADPLPPDECPPTCAPTDLEVLYRMQRSKLLRFVARWSGTGDAADIIQQLFARMIARASGANARIEAPEAYLRQAARNLIRSEARTAERRAAHLHVCLDDLPLAGPDPVAALEARDALRRFEAAIARLHPRTREIFLAHRIDGFSYGEIAFRTGLSVKTVEKHMSRAIAFLGRQLQP